MLSLQHYIDKTILKNISNFSGFFIKQTAIILFVLLSFTANSQDTTVTEQKKTVTLPEVLIRDHFDYKKFIQQIKDDSSFYKAFRNLRILGYTSFNDIKMLDKKGKTKASLNSKTKQVRKDGCRTTEIVEETTTGDFYNNKHQY